MSRSYNKNAPMYGTNDRPSDRYFKKLWHKKSRAKAKSLLYKGAEVCVVDKHSVSDLYDSSRDGSPIRISRADFKNHLIFEFDLDVKSGYLDEKERKRHVSVNYNNRK